MNKRKGRQIPAQAAMDFGNEDLPLFSGTAVTVEVRPFVQEQGASVTQGRFGVCPICFDSGVVRVTSKGKPIRCSCPAGQWAE